MPGPDSPRQALGGLSRLPQLCRLPPPAPVGAPPPEQAASLGIQGPAQHLILFRLQTPPFLSVDCFACVMALKTSRVLTLGEGTRRIPLPEDSRVGFCSWGSGGRKSAESREVKPSRLCPQTLVPVAPAPTPMGGIFQSVVLGLQLALCSEGRAVGTSWQFLLWTWAIHRPGSRHIMARPAVDLGCSPVWQWAHHGTSPYEHGPFTGPAASQVVSPVVPLAVGP